LGFVVVNVPEFREAFCLWTPQKFVQRLISTNLTEALQKGAHQRIVDDVAGGYGTGNATHRRSNNPVGFGSGVNDDDGTLKIPSVPISQLTACFGHVIPKFVDQLPYDKCRVAHD
jgi:hypothetical protein